MNRTLYSSPKYRKFTLDRNKALEQINLHAQTDVSRMLFEKLEAITGYISHMALQGDLSLETLKFMSAHLERYIDEQFSVLVPRIEARFKSMRRATFYLTYLGELEAIARATQKKTYIFHHTFKAKLANQEKQPTLLGKRLNLVIWNALVLLKHDIEQVISFGIILEKSPKEIVDDVKAAYPKVQGFKRPPPVLKNLREADKSDDDEEKKEFDFYGNLTNDADWDFAVNAYKDTELPPSRFDNNPEFDPDTGNFRYNWELEQEMTDDFVNQVRQGQIEAAEQLGIRDGVWVSIIDKKTCDECCLPRNGHTTSEIESMLKTGELDADECDAIVPPAHPFCRCDWAPVASTDEVEGPDWKSFGEWLDA